MHEVLYLTPNTLLNRNQERNTRVKTNTMMTPMTRKMERSRSRKNGALLPSESTKYNKNSRSNHQRKYRKRERKGNILPVARAARPFVGDVTEDAGVVNKRSFCSREAQHQQTCRHITIHTYLHINVSSSATNNLKAQRTLTNRRKCPYQNHMASRQRHRFVDTALATILRPMGDLTFFDFGGRSLL